MFRAIMNAIASGLRAAFAPFSWLLQGAWWTAKTTYRVASWPIRATARQPLVRSAARGVGRGIGWGARHTARTIDAAVGLPAGLMRRLGGGGPAPLPQPKPSAAAARDPEVDDALKALAHRQLRRRLARVPLSAVWKFACAEPSARGEIDLSDLPRDVRMWAMGLNDTELEAVRQAGLRATLRHVRGEESILGLRRVRKLVPEGDLLAPDEVRREAPRPLRRSRRLERDMEIEDSLVFA